MKYNYLLEMCCEVINSEKHLKDINLLVLHVKAMFLQMRYLTGLHQTRPANNIRLMLLVL